MALSKPRTIFGVHSITPYSRTDRAPYGIAQVLQGSTFTLEGSTWPDPIYDVPIREVLVFTQDNGVNYGIALISPIEDFKEASKVIQDILDSFEILDKASTSTITV